LTKGERKVTKIERKREKSQVTKRREVSLKGIVRGKESKDMTLERDQLKLSTQVGGASS
jgi:hypothetical protein